MAGETTSYTLGELVDLSQGLAINAKTSYLIGDFGTPLLRITDLINDTRCQFVDVTKVPQQCVVTPDELIYTRTGQVGLVFKGKRGVAHNNCFKVMPKPELLDSEYLYWFLSQESVRTHANAIASGSVQKDLNHRAFKSIPIEIPCLQIQRVVSAILNSIQDKIELNRRMNATLEAMARALFQSWFVDFDPVRAKLDGRKPSGIDPDVAALFPESLEDSPLGQIPKGWKVTTLGACIGFRSGFSFKSQDWQESGIPVVKIGSVKPGIIDLSQVSYVSEEIAQQAARYRLSTGDMLIGMTGYVGEVGLVPPSDSPPLLNQRVGKFVMAKPGTESLAFWYCTTRQPEFKAFVEARSHGTAQANVSGEAIMEFPVVLPPSGILDAFNRDCHPLLNRILSNHGESRTLATLRDTLLPKLLSGELSVAGGSF